MWLWAIPLVSLSRTSQDEKEAFYWNFLLELAFLIICFPNNKMPFLLLNLVSCIQHFGNLQMFRQQLKRVTRWLMRQLFVQGFRGQQSLQPGQNVYGTDGRSEVDINGSTLVSSSSGLNDVLRSSQQSLGSVRGQKANGKERKRCM